MTTLRDRIREEKAQKASNQRRWYDALSAAVRDGLSAGRGSTPEPMIVYTPKSILDPTPRTDEPVYHVADGVCGFAWVHLSAVKGPDGQEARKFINWLTGTQSPADPSLVPPVKCDKHYGGGHSIWIHEHNQSMSRKEAHARALAKALNEAIPGLRAYAQSRMD